MRSRSKQAGKLNTKETVSLAILGALMFASKVAMASLPNIHMNAVIIILGAVFFGWKVMYSIVIYIMLEGLTFGFSLWWVCYWYLWPLLGAAAVLMRNNRSPLIWAVVAGAHGLIFGALCSIPYLFIGGFQMALSSWISGIPFDLAHCAGNFVLTLILFKPLYAAMVKICVMKNKMDSE